MYVCVGNKKKVRCFKKKAGTRADKKKEVTRARGGRHEELSVLHQKKPDPTGTQKSPTHTPDRR